MEKIVRGRSSVAFFAVIAFVLLTAFILHAPLERAIFCGFLDMETGSWVSVRELHVRADRTLIEGIRVERRGEELLAADSIELRYQLSAAGERRFGLLGFSLERPRLRVVRFQDGRFNVAETSSPFRTPSSSAAQAPWRCNGRIHDASIVLVDPSRRFPASRIQRIGSVNGNVTIDSAGLTHYALQGEFMKEPWKLTGSVDRERGFALHRFAARELPLPAALNALINSDGALVLGGRAQDVDIRAYASLDTPSGDTPYHISGEGRVSEGALHVIGFHRLFQAIHGQVQFSDDGVLFSDLRGTLAAVPLRASGGIYDRSAPKFRLSISALGPLQDLRAAFAFSSHYPLQGAAALSTVLEGRVANPLTLTHFSAPHAVYAAFPIEHARGLVTYYAGGVDVMAARGAYGALSLTSSGHIELRGKAALRLSLEAKARGDALPFTAQLLPSAQLEGSVLLTGAPTALDVRGVVSGSHADGLLSLLHLNARGEGAFSPLIVTGADGSSLMGAFYLDRPHNSSAFWLVAHEYRLTESSRPPLFPRLPDMVLPNVTARLDGTVAGAGTPSSFSLAGRGSAHGLTTGRLALDEFIANFAGSPTNVHLANVHVRGPWGAFQGSGGYAGKQLALDGAYQGSFERLRSLTGDLGAHGSLVSPLRMLLAQNRSVFQVTGAHSLRMAVHGVPVDGIAGTLEVRERGLRLTAADLSVAGGRVVASGELGKEKSIGVSARSVNLARVGTLVSGTLGGIGNIVYAKSPRFEGGLFLSGGSYAGQKVEVNGDLSLSAGQANLQYVDMSLGKAYGVGAGSLRGIDSRDPSYDLAIAIHGADTGSLGISNERYFNGSIDADVHVGGHGMYPSMQGIVSMPEGSINGLRFSNAVADVNVQRSFANIRSAGVKVGSTTLQFSGGTTQHDFWMHVKSPQADLADFNDFFPEGNTLAGKGHIALDFEKRAGDRSVLKTGADIAVADLHYRSFALGNALAHWHTVGSAVLGDVAFGGSSGRLRIGGRMLPARDTSLQAFLKHSWYDVAMDLEGLNLGVWLPTLGYHEPLVGRIDARALVHGRYPALNVTGAMNMSGGSIGRYPIDRFTIAANSSVRHTTITDAVLEVPSLALKGTGSFGLAENKTGSFQLAQNDPLLLDVHASSANIGSFLTRAIARGRTLSGTLEADLHVAGTPKNPRITGDFDVERARIRGVVIPRVLGSLALDKRNVVVNNLQVTFSKGSLDLGGSLPFTLFPPGIGPDSAPVALDLAARKIDLSVLQPLLPAGSQLAGVLDGLVSVMGRADDPRLLGKLAFTQGLLQTPFESVPLRNVSADVTFGKTKIHVRKLHADLGNGSLDAYGTATVSNLTQLKSDVAYSLSVAAKHAQLNFPAYGNGTVDGNLKLSHLRKELPSLAGDITLNDGSIPFSALYHPDDGREPPPLPLDLAFNIDAKAGRNVHVRSPNMDIITSGTVNVGGALSNMVFNGSFDSSNGTLTYFNRIFRVISGTVTFEPDLGIVPLLDAKATTHVFDPGSLTGSADIALMMTGPVTNLTLGLDSDPGYDRQKILALLLNAPQLGALLSNGGTTVRATGGQVVGEEAFSLVNARFTQTLLSPLETAFGQALGLSNLNVNVDYTGGVNVTARKLLGKRINAVYASGVSYPYPQSFGFELKPNARTSAQMTFYQTLGQTNLTTNLNATANRILLAQPLSGTNGFSFTFLQYLP